MSARTRWGAVGVLIAAGIVGALQIGKAAIAMPLLQDDLGISLVFASWILGAYGLLGAAFGLPAGAAAALFSPKKTLIAGLAIAGLASLAGGAATNGVLLLATRIIEGVGFLAIVLSVPRLLRLVAAPDDAPFTLALWGAYMPTGSAVMMLAGPAMAAHGGWQALWHYNGVVALVYAAMLFVLKVPEPAASEQAPAAHLSETARALISSPGLLLLGAMFGVYTFQYAALAGLLPTLLIERGGLSIHTAGFVSAAAVVANAIGNLSAGLLVRRGVPFWLVAAVAITFVSIATVGIFTGGAPVVLVAVLAAASLGVSGLIPASIFSVTPHFAVSPALMAMTLGLLIQTANIGNLFGAAALAAFVEHFGWSRAPLVFLAVTIAGVAIAVGVRAVGRNKS